MYLCQRMQTEYYKFLSEAISSTVYCVRFYFDSFAYKSWIQEIFSLTLFLPGLFCLSCKNVAVINRIVKNVRVAGGRFTFEVNNFNHWWKQWGNPNLLFFLLYFFVTKASVLSCFVTKTTQTNTLANKSQQLQFDSAEIMPQLPGFLGEKRWVGSYHVFAEQAPISYTSFSNSHPPPPTPVILLGSWGSYPRIRFSSNSGNEQKLVQQMEATQYIDNLIIII